MDYDKYYLEKHDGSYSVHFLNAKGLPLDEIKALFSQFGETLSVKNNGKQYSFCYVTYATLEDVQKCIDGLRNHSLIKILREKSKKTPINSNEGSNTEDNNWKGLNSDVASDISSTSKESWRNKKISNNSQRSNSETRRFTESPNTHDLVQSKNDNGDMEFSPPLSCGDEFNVNSNTCDKEKIPPLVSINEIKRNHLRSNHNKGLSRRIIIPAAEVIVANVHPSYGIHYILHLFDKYEPISVTLMKTIPLTNLRYCHVYFKTDQNAEQVEKEFDYYALHGNHLIVLRAHKCIEKTA